LYALRGAFVECSSVLAVRIPLYQKGDDGLIGAFTEWDLMSENQGFDHQGIVTRADAAFAIESMSPWRP
jgi:hypothetical protein